MNFQTKIPLTKQPNNQIDYHSKIFLIGSCFAENIGDKFEYFKFQTKINPFGVLFHPLAIESLIKRSVNKDYYTPDELQFYNEQWCCLDAHSKLNSNSKKDLLNVLNTRIDETFEGLKYASHIIITLGTSWVYRHISSDKIVANCHKLPQKQFLKELLSIAEITESIEGLVSLVRTINPDVSFMFTVSPVRHLKDGFIENTQSKSHLIAAIHQVINRNESLNHHNVYFPSFEIMMDELRDYRFYKTDMLHPSEVAIDYIWEKFKTVWFSDNALGTLEDVLGIQRDLSHKPFNSNSEAYQLFIANIKGKIERLQQKYSHIDF